MTAARIYVEGGGETSELRTRCREGFSKLLEKSGLEVGQPRFVACGSRRNAYDRFESSHGSNKDEAYVALLVDSEEPVVDQEHPWDHLGVWDKWPKPSSATDDQVMLMTTCMETWIAADRGAISSHFHPKGKKRLIASALPPLANLETRDRHFIQDALVKATADCKNAYKKGKRSFEALAAVDPKALQYLPSFARFIRILNDKLS